MARSSWITARLSTVLAVALLASCASTPPPKVAEEGVRTPSIKPSSQRQRTTQRSATPVASDLRLCRTNISNAPKANADGVVTGVRKTINVSGVRILITPATKSCLSSGYGYRKNKLHKGLDYFSKDNGEVLAAADGVILEAVKRTDYGNMVIIDHGKGVYTRYAHLASFGSRAKIGKRVKRGQALGPIGGSGAAFATHLHFEILRGVYDTPKKSFGLEPADPFSFK